MDRDAAGGGGRLRPGDRRLGNTGGELIEWLAERGLEVRRRQRGVVLLTAHGAKGLEFDHVVVLDGDWARAGRD